METLISSKIHRLSLVNRSSHTATQLPSARGPVLEFFSFFFFEFSKRIFVERVFFFFKCIRNTRKLFGAQNLEIKSDGI